MAFAKMMPHKITYWRTESDGYGGYKFYGPHYISGRWETRPEEVALGNGETIVAKDIVYTTEEVPLGAFAYKGLVTGVVDPTILGSDLKQVKQVQGVPNIRGGETLYKIYLR